MSTTDAEGKDEATKTNPGVDEDNMMQPRGDLEDKVRKVISSDSSASRGAPVDTSADSAR